MAFMVNFSVQYLIVPALQTKNQERIILFYLDVGRARHDLSEYMDTKMFTHIPRAYASCTVLRVVVDDHCELWQPSLMNKCKLST